EVTDVADGGLDHVVRSEVAGDGAGLRGGLDDDQPPASRAVSLCRLAHVAPLGCACGQQSSGTPDGASPTSSRRRASRRWPTMRYAGPSARGPTSAPAIPAAASAAPTAPHAGSSLAPSAR